MFLDVGEQLFCALDAPSLEALLKGLAFEDALHPEATVAFAGTGAYNSLCVCGRDAYHVATT